MGEINNYSRPLSYYAWQRLKKNKAAIFGMVIIAISITIAILGYTITPDSTPDANEQLLEISVKQPGFKIMVLKTRKNQETNRVNFFNKMFFGEQSDYRSIPIYSYRFEEEYIIYEEYTGSVPNNGTEININLVDANYAIDYNKPILNENGMMVFFEFGTENIIRKSIVELRELVEKNNIVEQKYLLGTDRSGRDMLSRLMIGTRISLAVGFISVFISILIGVFLGAVSGYFRGWIDNVIIWFINVVWSIPTLLLVITITLILGKGFWQIFVAVGLTMWVEVARVIRGQIISLREKEFVEAGRALGFTNSRIIFKHVIPNVLGPVIVISAANFASAILIEAGLSFLGIGAQPPMSSWGAMINAHRGYIIVDAAYLAILPGLAIMFMVLAFILLGNGLRDAIDTKLGDDDAVMVY